MDCRSAAFHELGGSDLIKATQIRWQNSHSGPSGLKANDLPIVPLAPFFFFFVLHFKIINLFSNILSVSNIIRKIYIDDHQ